MEYSHLFSDVGVTHLFWCHKVIGQDFIPGAPDIKLLSFPLYPVNYLDSLPSSKNEPRYLYSFIGAEAKDFYLTNSRNLIEKHLKNDERSLIEIRKNWHFNQIVYDHQIRKSNNSNTEALINDDHSQAFLSSLGNSLFILCPSGSGPNSIRLWETIASGRIPVVLADTYEPPCDSDLWNLSTIVIKEDEESIISIPDRLRVIISSNKVSSIKKYLSLIRALHGPTFFIGSILKFLFGSDLSEPKI